MAMLSDIGINVVESEEAEDGDGAAKPAKSESPSRNSRGTCEPPEQEDDRRGVEEGFG